jgi:hypothetical protein
MNVAANKQGGEWDFGLLTDVLSELDGQGIDMDLTGFSREELEHLLTDEWGVNPAADPGDYDPDAETFTIKIEGVSTLHKDEVLEAVQAAIASTNYEYEAKAY